MSMVIEILEMLWNSEVRFKGGIRTNFFGIPIELLGNKNSFKSSLSNLKKKGFISSKAHHWTITNKGKEYLEKSKNNLKQFQSPFEKSAPHVLLVIFDIPESKRTERNWFRHHLKRFGYKMIQKSVWVGPNPLPKEFVLYAKKIGLESCIKKFKLAKHYKIQK